MHRTATSASRQRPVRHLLLGLMLPLSALTAYEVAVVRPQLPDAPQVAVDAVSKSGCVEGAGASGEDLNACLEGMGGPDTADLANDRWVKTGSAEQELSFPQPTTSALLKVLLTEGATFDLDEHDHHLPSKRPVANARITSNFGHRQDPFGRGRAFHGGIDFAGPLGTPIQSAGAGMVIQAGVMGGYGKVVMIDHGNGHTTVYAHAQKVLVRDGQMVMAGQSIATLGSTGRSTGPHLHFEVRVGGLRVDPRRYLHNG
jgi:murein DD-endopeptidase MepM/ murein hydrolase activator NlpD